MDILKKPTQPPGSRNRNHMQIIISFAYFVWTIRTNFLHIVSRPILIDDLIWIRHQIFD